MLYEAQCSFSHPGVDRQFQQHQVYRLEDDAEDVLASAIAEGKLRPVDEETRLGVPDVPPEDGDGPGEEGDASDSAGDAPDAPES